MAKYGSLNKGFTEEQLRAFFMAIDNEKYGLLFSYMAYLGLRIGEAVKVNVKDINQQSRELRVKSEKTRRLDLLIIPSNLHQESLSFIERHKAEIDKAQGFMFYKDSDRSERKEQYLESNYVRKVFRQYVVKAGLDEIYDTSDGAVQRRLHLLTTHSLRHYAISKFARQTNGNLILSAKFARHLKPQTTMTYIHTDKEELYREIDKAFAK
jgi:integrase